MTFVVNALIHAVSIFQLTIRGSCIYTVSKYFGAKTVLIYYDSVNLGNENIYLPGLLKGLTKIKQISM